MAWRGAGGKSRPRTSESSESTWVAVRSLNQPPGVALNLYLSVL